MTRAEEFHRVSKDLFVWEAYEPKVKCELTSCAVRVGDGLVLVDPIKLTGDALEELCAEAAPVRIVCTNANHARASEFYRERFCIPVAAHEAAIEDIDVEVDEKLDGGTRIEGLLEVCHIEGAPAGEIALRTPSGIVCMGDALIHLPGTGFGLLPEKYCTNANLMRDSLQKLLRWDFHVLTFAHGLPLVNNARLRLETLIA